MAEALENADEQELVARAGGGDELAFETIVRRYEGHIGKLMWRFSHDVEDHVELVHEVFVQAYLSLGRFRGDAPLVHWLSAIASRTGLRWWKKQTRDRRFCQLPDNLVDSRAEESASPMPENAAPLLAAMLAELPENDRAALTLTYYEKKNAKEVAELLGWTHSAARMRISRARRKLQQIARAHGLVWEE